ncbi:hypothetical protein [Labilibacter marinus]|uniref:hypothetical protein n=1 Tax=Labilibacter marinus TaxID=1477105 RepID=UPI00094FEAAF|nr:hypothetical protein [Labilibacter marinus]
MNYFILAAAIVSLMAVLGHFTIGAKDFLRPIMNSETDEIPRYVMKSVFHYISIFQVLTTLFLFLTAVEFNCILFELGSVAKFIGVIYAGFGIVQLIIAFNAPIKGAAIKMFQWIFWFAIAALVFIGL